MQRLTEELIDKFCGTGLFLEIVGPSYYGPIWVMFIEKSGHGMYKVHYAEAGIPETMDDAQVILDTINEWGYTGIHPDDYWTGDTISYNEIVEMCEEFGAVHEDWVDPDIDDEDYWD